MTISDAQKRAVAKYNAANYDRIEIKVPKGRKADVEAHAKSKGESINGLVNSLLREDMGLSEKQWKGLEILAEIVVGHSKGMPIVFQKLENDHSNYCVQFAGNGKYFVEFEKAAEYLFNRWGICVSETIF